MYFLIIWLLLWQNVFFISIKAIGNKKYFKEKDKKIEMTCNEAMKSANKPKNRYPDISPCKN